MHALRLALKLTLWTATLLVFTGGTLVVFLAVVGDDFYRRAGQHVLDQSIDREVRVKGAFTFDVDLEPTLVMTDFTIANAPWASTRNFAQVDRVEVQVALRPLLSGVVLVRRLVVDGLRIDLEMSSDGRANWDMGPPEREEERPETDGPDAFYPLFQFISLKNMSVSYKDRRSGRSIEVYLARLDKRDHATDDRSEIAGEGRFNERPFEITGRLGTVEDALLAARPFPVELSLTLPGLEAALGGSVANLPHGEGFDLEISARSASIGTLLDGLALDRFVEGSAEVSGRLSGDLDALSLTDVSFDLLTNEGRRLHAEGAIGDLIGGNGLDLRFGGLLSGDAKVLQALPAALQDLDEIELAGHVTGDLESLELEDFEGRLTHSSGAELNVTGRASIELSDDRRAISAATLRGTLSLPDPSLLENLSGTELPPIGPMQASGDLVLTDHEISIETFRAELAEFGGLVLVARGRLGTLASFTEGFSLDPDLAFSASMEKSLPVLAFAERQFPELGPIELAGRLSHGESGFHVQYLRAEFGSRDRLWAAFDGDIGPIRPDQEQPVAALSGTLRFAWPSTAATALLLGQTVPELLGAVEGRLSVSGTPEALRFSDVRIEARSTDGLESSARGEVGRITFDPKFAVGAVRLDLNAKSESTNLFAQLLGYAWPELGEVRASSRLNGGPDIFALDDFTVSVGPADQPLLRVAGAIKDLVALKGIKLDGEFKVPAARFLRPGPPEDAAKLGELQGRFVLSDADGTIGLEVLSIEVVGSNLLTASLEGVFDDIADTDLLSLQGSLRVPDPAALGRVFGLEDLDLASLAFEGRLSGSNEAFTAEGETRVGKTALTGTMTGSFAGERPKFVARLTSPVFYFEDFGLTPEPDAAAGEQQAPVAERKDAAAQRLFSDEPLPFERLSAIDLDLEILLDELDGVSLDIDQAQLHLVLENGVLTIDPLRFNLVGGLAEIRASADTTPTFPELSLDVRIDDLDLGDLLGQLKADVPLDGELDLILNLQAIGRSPRELADSLTGEIDLALARGAVRTRLFALTALDLGSWLFARSTRRGYSELNCLILRFDVVDGEAESEVLVIDTANVRATGDGNVDLNDEQLKIEFSPRAKNRRIVRLTTPFAIEGPLSDPTLRVSSSGAVARMIGEIAAKPLNLLGRLLPFVSDRNKDVDNPCLRLEPVEDIEIPTEG